jgi:hypothetical protein
MTYGDIINVQRLKHVCKLRTRLHVAYEVFDGLLKHVRTVVRLKQSRQQG